MKNFAEQSLKNQLRHHSHKKTQQVFNTLGLVKGFYKPFEYSVSNKKEPELRHRKRKFRVSTLMLRRKIKLFYHLKHTRSALRKLFKRQTIKKSVLSNNSYHAHIKQSKKFYSADVLRGSIGAMLESRFDVVLFRLNLISSIYEGRTIILTKSAFVVKPDTRKRIYRKFFTFFLLKKPHYKVPLFYLVSLKYNLSLLRKTVLLNLLYAQKLISYPPNYLLCNYKTMLGLRHINPPVSKIYYPFYGTLAFFLGTALYF
jgi:ribosomal protein S4